MCLLRLILFTLLASMVQCKAKKGDLLGYKTTYACEGRTLNIICDKDVIHLIRANYGRFSISICNDHGNIEWRVNCMSHQSSQIMQEMCSLKPNCSINVSSSTFPDPCPGTLKYLEVQYHCGTELPSFTTASSLLPTLKATGASNATPTENSNGTLTTYHSVSTSLPTLPIITRHSSTTHYPSTSSPSSKPTSETTSIAPIEDKITEVLTTEISKDVTSEQTTPSYSKDYHCEPTLSRGINWTWTKAGETAMSKCPEGASGIAKWFCKQNPIQWSPDVPDLNQCQSLWLENIKSRLENGDSILSITSELALMSITKPLFSKDLKTIGELIQQALYKSVNSMENFLDMWYRYHVLRELLQSFVQTLSNLLDFKQHTAWSDLPLLERKLVLSSLLEGVEENALLLLETSSDDGSFNLVRSNVLLSLQVLKSKTLTSILFPVHTDIFTEDEGMQWMHTQDSILLQPQTIQEYSKNGFFKIVFTAFNNLNGYLNPSSKILHSSTVDFPDNITRIVNSRTIGAWLERSGNLKLSQPVLITLKHLIEGNVTNPICVHWDFHSRDWSAQGCWVELSNKSHTICACDHLSNFAVIMDVEKNMVSVADIQFLHCIISVGCIFAIICLLATVIILYTISANIREENTFIHQNIFLCLLLSEVVFVCGIKQTNFYLSCAIVAGILQYLFLATFSWMFFDCYHQYVMLIGTGDSKKEKVMWYYAVAYIIPGLITLVSVIVDPSSYGTKTYCWLQADNYFVFSFVGPAVSIIFGGLVFIFISMCILCHNQTRTTVIKGQDDLDLSIYKWWNQRSVILVILLSLTWTAGLIYMNGESVSLAYSFSVLNSLQGATILALYCFRNKKVNQELKISYKHYLCSCCEKKEEEPHCSGQSSHAECTQKENTESSQQFWNLAADKVSLSTLKSTAAGTLTSADLKGQENGAKNDHCERLSTHWKCSYYSREHELGNQSIIRTGCNIPNAQHNQYRHFLVGSDPNGQFLEHIYETIDGDTLPADDDPTACHQPQPVENYYADPSDYSQHSSSNYGYDQQPLLIAGIQYKQPNFHSLSKDSHNAYGKRHLREEVEEKYCSNSRNPSEDETILPQNSFDAGLCMSSNTQANSVKQLDNASLPDLLKCPGESPAVLAVLDGDKVISKVQQCDSVIKPQCKLSTYC